MNRRGSNQFKKQITVLEEIEQEVLKLLPNWRLSNVAISRIFNVSHELIRRIAKKNNIKRRNPKIKNLENCKWCSTEFVAGKSSKRPNRGKYCSKACYTHWQKSQDNRGQNHPSWIDGGKHESSLQKLRRSAEWKEWRKAVYERDNYTCQHCKQVGGTLHPHHIKLKSKYPELIFSVDNGLTLCKQCHMKVHVRTKKASLMHMPSFR